MKNFLKSPFMREFGRIVMAVGAALLLGFIVTLFVSKDPVGAYRAFLLGINPKTFMEWHCFCLWHR